MQFDVFLGYDGTIHEAGWFPVTCEIFNDGPSFNAMVEITGSSDHRRVPVELPTNTRKRLIVPMFASGGRYGSSWTVKLLDSSGKTRQERADIRPTIVAWNAVLIGAMPRTFGGMPTMPEMKQNRNLGQTELRPVVARMQAEQFPDNPIALEGLNMLYLNSEKILDFNVNQITALLGWVRSGGHLIVGVEQNGDVNSTPWFKQFAPVELTGSVNARIDREVQAWLKNQPIEEDDLVRTPRRTRMVAQTDNVYSSLNDDGTYKPGETAVATGSIKDGSVVINGPNGPLAVQAPRGRGKLTLLTFNPEREPFRSWKQRSYFWAKMSGIPGEFFSSQDFSGFSGFSVDGVFGALIDSRQIKKLPVTWLLLLLVVYLVVIGPFDQWWLKKINRQMLTWITFPAYVVLFSLLIYFIGYKLRAGETEWNELNMVDVLPRGDKVDLRGHTYISIYSSANSQYPIIGEKGYAAMRGELLDIYAGGREGSKIDIEQSGNSFKARVSVPVWTSLLYANDWFKTNDTPFTVKVTPSGGGWQVEFENLLSRPLENTRIVINQIIFDVGSIGANEKKSVHFAETQGTQLRTFVQQNGNYFQRAAELRRSPLGDSAGGHLEDRPLTATVASFISYLDDVQQNNRSFLTPAGIDLAQQAARGDAIVFAFLPDFTFNQDLNQFHPPRMKRDTLLRLTVPMKKSSI
jgi:hypothetical protein